MNIIYLLLYIGAAACFGIAAFAGRSTLGSGRGGRGGNINLLAAGLFLWVLVPLLVQLQTLDD
ncbi:MAG: hypothetical protein KY451_15100 [Actinobacteria bacterium]|nr:hypothetical protein [Actinomycetota bacterium]